MRCKGIFEDTYQRRNKISDIGKDDCIESAQELTDSAAEASQLVERAADPFAVFILFSVLNTQCYFCVLGCASDKSD